MRRSCLLAVALSAFWASTIAPALAFEPLQGCFIADAVCPAPTSLRGARDPGDIATEVDRAYPLLGANRKDQASHYQIRIPGADPGDRWVAVGCGHTVEACDHPAGPPASSADYVLAASWQPAFCEAHRRTPECRSQTAGRFDASHLALHGLWPEPRSNVYCGVSRALRSADEADRWRDLPPVDLSERTRAALEVVMPGTRSDLERHEWIKHGTCAGARPEAYFNAALALMSQLNASPVRALFAARIGERLGASKLRAAFDEGFGAGAGARVAIGCAGGLISELEIHLRGAPGPSVRLADLIAAAAPVDAGCAGGQIDPAGFRP
jgi:ribonuclease T2